jgi:hypothetical protein
MLSILVNKFPEIMNLIKLHLVAIVRESERRYNAPIGSYWYRFFRMEDNGINGTAKTWEQTYTTADEEELIAGTAASSIPVSNTYAIFGWYCDFDPTEAGYVRIAKNGVTKWEMPLRVIYGQENPRHLYIDIDTVIVGYQQDKVEVFTYQETGGNQIGLSLPFMFRIASKSALNLE